MNYFRFPLAFQTSQNTTRGSYVYKSHYFHYRGGHRLHGCVLGDLVRYRSQARKFKGTVIQEMKLGQSYWLTNCEPDTML